MEVCKVLLYFLWGTSNWQCCFKMSDFVDNSQLTLYTNFQIFHIISHIFYFPYQSTSPNATNIAMFRPNMTEHPFPTLTPMADQRYSFRFTAPLTAVWFRATQPASELCCPPPYMDPVSYIIGTMSRANDARLCAPPRTTVEGPT